TLSGISITGTNRRDFSETNNCGPSLAGFASCTFSVVFTPIGTNKRTAVLSITSSASTVPITVTLSGTGLVDVSVLPTSLSFGNQAVGTSSARMNVTLKNVGPAISITSIQITGMNRGDFIQANTCGSSLATGASCKIAVTFAPPAPFIR